MAQTENAMRKWLDGQISLGTAANWEKDEIRIISEVAYTLAQQGRRREAVVLFKGLLAIAPATAYFHAALGALHLRLGKFAESSEYLSAALNIEPDDIVSLVNRGESRIKTGQPGKAREDLEKALNLTAQQPTKQLDINDETALTIKRARALLRLCKDK